MPLYTVHKIIRLRLCKVLIFVRRCTHRASAIVYKLDALPVFYKYVQKDEENNETSRIIRPHHDLP